MTQHDNICIVPPKEGELIGGLKQYSDGWHLELFKGAYLRLVKLPPGDWRIIGTTDTMGDKEWREVVNFVDTGDFKGILYEDYQATIAKYRLTSPSASGHSLLQSLGITQPCVVLVNEKE